LDDGGKELLSVAITAGCSDTVGGGGGSICDGGHEIIGWLGFVDGRKVS